jgi:NADH:ubiquinone oxidoreductase subunit E
MLLAKRTKSAIVLKLSIEKQARKTCNYRLIMYIAEDFSRHYQSCSHGGKMPGLQSVLQDLDKDRSNLIKALQRVQESEGYVSDGAVLDISTFFAVPAVDVEGVLSFYAQFKRTKPGKYIISVCDGTACHIKGASLIINWISDTLHIKDGETTEDHLFSLQTVACLGCCSLAPVISVNGKVYGNLNRKKLLKVLRQHKKMG